MASIVGNLLVVAFSNLLTTVVNFIYYPILTRGLGFSAEILVFTPQGNWTSKLGIVD
ncbi:hypothetical protein [Mesotoga sp.]|uniref:hypothetical protein n=1 Tax=Mesotoga sp. TaxID=2053577 RepID=UPI001BD6C431|nr:hypothetical protein [Mesotoga sp.]